MASGDRSLCDRRCEQVAGRQQERYGGQEGRRIHCGKGRLIPFYEVVGASADLLVSTGICRQPRYPLPRNIGEERVERRASLLDHGPSDQGENGYHHRQQQAYGAGWTGSRSSIRISRWLLLVYLHGARLSGPECIHDQDRTELAYTLPFASRSLSLARVRGACSFPTVLDCGRC